MHNNLNTDRLILRPYKLSDALRVQELAGDRKVSELTANIPYPYKDGMAEAWIHAQQKLITSGQAVIFAVTLKESNELIGTVGLTEITYQFSNLGYWIGSGYWGKGYCTEAVKALIAYVFRHLNYSLISAHHLNENVASGQVLTKCGFTFTGNQALTVKGVQRHVKMYTLHNKSS